MVRGAEYVMHGSNATQQVSAKKRQIGVAKGVTAVGTGNVEREEERKRGGVQGRKERKEGRKEGRKEKRK